MSDDRIVERGNILICQIVISIKFSNLTYLESKLWKSVINQSLTALVTVFMQLCENIYSGGHLGLAIELIKVLLICLFNIKLI